jgi:uncharacterized protein
MHLLRAAAIGAAGLTVVLAQPVLAQSQTRIPPSEAHSTSKRVHRVVIQVSQNDPAVMNLALNNAENLVTFYKDKGEKIDVEFVAYGAGLSMVRSDTSPVKERLTAMSSQMKNVTFTGCGNTLANQSKQENKSITLVPEARLVPAGIARIVELEEQGWTYVRP